MNQTLTLVNNGIEIAKTSEQIGLCYKVMRQLRPHISEEQAFIDQVERQINDGYHMVYIKDHEGIKAIVGYRYLEFLAWGKVLYIDDLITDVETRKNGHGSKLLKWVIEQARNAGCDQVHLDSGPQRHDAHKLYFNHGFKIIGYHFALDFK
jgi:GNAT superfamily N-acetyltransferase